jgi:pyruvate formate lyase activating enzyme
MIRLVANMAGQRTETTEGRRGWIFNIQKYSVHDGPGIRTTVFFKGCPLACAWCHNPEGISPKPEIIVQASRCLVCGECRKACPLTASVGDRHGNNEITPSPGSLPIPPASPNANPGGLPARNEACTFCGACIDACPTEARQMAGRPATVHDIMDVILQDRIFYEESGGGVTLSGGEPLMQPWFLEALLLACRARDIHTAVDTSGLAAADHLRRIAPLTDLFLFDLKLMDDALHRKHCGVSNSLILENLKSLATTHSNLWLRLPLIPGINDSDDNLEALARFAAALPGVRQVNLLPYHKTGVRKFQQVGQSYALDHLPGRERAYRRRTRAGAQGRSHVPRVDLPQPRGSQNPEFPA